MGGESRLQNALILLLKGNRTLLVPTVHGTAWEAPQAGFELVSPIKVTWICSTNHQKTSVTKCSNTIDPSKLKRHGTHAYRTSINAIPKRGAILRRIEGGYIFLFCSKPKLHIRRRPIPVHHEILLWVSSIFIVSALRANKFGCLKSPRSGENCWVCFLFCHGLHVLSRVSFGRFILSRVILSRVIADPLRKLWSIP